MKRDQKLNLKQAADFLRSQGYETMYPPRLGSWVRAGRIPAVQKVPVHPETLRKHWQATAEQWLDAMQIVDLPWTRGRIGPDGHTRPDPPWDD